MTLKIRQSFLTSRIVRSTSKYGGNSLPQLHHPTFGQKEHEMVNFRTRTTCRECHFEILLWKKTSKKFGEFRSLLECSLIFVPTSIYFQHGSSQQTHFTRAATVQLMRGMSNPTASLNPRPAKSAAAAASALTSSEKENTSELSISRIRLSPWVFERN